MSNAQTAAALGGEISVKMRSGGIDPCSDKSRFIGAIFGGQNVLFIISSGWRLKCLFGKASKMYWSGSSEVNSERPNHIAVNLPYCEGINFQTGFYCLWDL